MPLGGGETRLGFGGLVNRGESPFYPFGKPLLNLQSVLGAGFKIFHKETDI